MSGDAEKNITIRPLPGQLAIPAADPGPRRGATLREDAAHWIEKALESGRSAGLEGKALAGHVRAKTYPGKSAGYSYLKMWREEFRYRVKGAYRPRARGVAAEKKPGEGQGKLFD